uniref:Uncharacterized protein n=1 Tax=Setaria viridis TaxID=4556 RepID=A0A4U6VZG8_SETVI|nr:uncharacterized protein LOC117844448 [Setaria viridis]TKW35468.1 hypothetical protein SEVIR_2G374500v2 [Setaria viridis]
MLRDGVAEGLELEAALAAESASRLREAVASMDGFLDTDVDSLPLLTMELIGDGSILTPNPSRLNKDGEDQSLEVPAARPFEDSSERLNRLIAMQKRLSEATREALPTQVRKRIRLTLAVNTSNVQSASSPTPVSPVHKRNKRTGSKNHLFGSISGLRGQHPIATCRSLLKLACGTETMSINAEVCASEWFRLLKSAASVC